jgi:hypothetical protein
MRAVEAHTLLVRETAAPAPATAATAVTADISTRGSIDSSSTVISLSSAQLLQLQQAQLMPPLKLLLGRGVHRPRVGYEGHVRQHTALTWSCLRGRYDLTLVLNCSSTVVTRLLLRDSVHLIQVFLSCIV